jgi:hypothetical protein
MMKILYLYQGDVRNDCGGVKRMSSEIRLTGD